MTITELEAKFTRYAIPYSRISSDGKKIDAEGSSRKLLDKKPSNKQVASLRLWLGQRADRRFVCWCPQEQKVILIAEFLMPSLDTSSLVTEGSVDVTECVGLEYVLGTELQKAVNFN